MDENLKILIDKNLIIEEEEDKDKKYLIYNGCLLYTSDAADEL